MVALSPPVLTTFLAPAAPTSLAALATASDAALVAAAQAGCLESWGALWQRYHAKLATYLRFQVGGAGLTTDGDDLASETFLRAQAGLASYQPQPGGTFSAWLYRIARNLAIDTRRARPAKAPVYLSWVGQSSAGMDSSETGGAGLPVCNQLTDPAAEGAAALIEQRALLAPALASLSPKQRRCIELRWLADLSVRETARQMGTNEDVVKQLQVRAFRRLRAALGSRKDVLAA